MVVMHLQGFIDLLSAVPYGSNGFSMLVRGNGSITAASASAKWINEFLAVHEIDYNIFYDSDPGDDFIQTLKGLLIEWNLITNARGINPRNASLYIPYRSTAYSKSIIYRGDQWEIQAQMLTNSSSGLTFTVVIVTKDDDFNGNLLVGIRNTGLLSLAVLVVSICLSALVTRCVTRPLNKIVTFMERAVRVVGKIY